MNEQYIPTTAEPLPFTPKALASIEKTSDGDGALPEIPVFYIKPVTATEFDRLGFELFRYNIVPVSQESFRAQTIEEIFVVFGEEEGEARAALLDQFWQGEDVYRDQMSEWHEQDRQRILDQAEGAPARKPLPLPTHMVGLRDRNRALLLAEEIRKRSRTLRDMTVEMQSYEPKQRSGIARLVILGWEGLSTPFVRDDGIVPEETYDALRVEIGKEAFRELELFCASLGAITAREVGNSGLPLETERNQEHSPEPNGAAEASDGESTSAETRTLSNSSSGQLPESGSDQTTERSSNSTSPSTGASENIVDTPAEPMPAHQSG